MPRKTQAVQKKNIKAVKKKINLKRLIFTIVAVIIVLAFLFISIYNPKRSRPVHDRLSSYGKSSPSFRKDGSLSIILMNKTSSITLDIEIADNDEERTRGLMDRQILPENAGMLFIFPNDAPRSFWMKNTFISLDIIFINSQKEIVSIQKYTQPKTTYSLPSEKPAKYVLEVNAGFSDKFGINPGDKIEFSY